MINNTNTIATTYSLFAGIPSKPKEDAFSDLLGSGFNPKKGESESKTLKDMKSKTSINNALDPDRARVRDGHNL